MKDEEFLRCANEYKDTIYRVALNYLRNTYDAEDIVQETLMKLYLHKGTFQDDEHIKHWLIRIALNLCSNIVRSRKRHPEVNIEELTLSVPFKNERQTEVFATLMELPEKYRLALYLYYYEDYSTSEIAEVLGISVSAVTTRLSRGRNIIKSFLMEDEVYG